jgi:hypothetical protein
LILAQLNTSRAERLRSMGESFSKDDPGGGLGILIRILCMLICLACIFGLVYMISRIQRRRANPHQARPFAVFWRMQAGLGLGILDRLRLWRLARHINLDQPTALLISEQLFDQAVATYSRKPSRFASQGGIATSFAAVRHQLFGSSEN